MTRKLDRKTTYLLPGFHSDVVWLEDQRDYAYALMLDLDQNLTVCEFDPFYGVFLHELTYLRPYMEEYPERRAYLKRLIAERRIGTGGSHSQPAENLISGEGIVRNILYGMLYHNGVLGDSPEIYNPWDVFGHCAQLAQICAKSGFKGCIWSKPIYGCHAVFWHVSPDGTRLLFKRTNYGFDIDWRCDSEETFTKSLNDFFPEITSRGLTTNLRIDATDFKPPTAWMAGGCGRLREGKHSVIVSGHAHTDWFRRASREIRRNKLDIPVTARDFEYHHQGTGLSRIEFKIANRIAEHLLADGEKFATIAALLGAEYPDKALDKSWRQILFNQHHDSITGPCCDRGYLDIMLVYREAVELAAEVRDNSLRFISSRINISRSAPARNARAITVFNGLNWPRTDIVRTKIPKRFAPDSMTLRDHRGRDVAFQVVGTTGSGKGAEFEIAFRAERVPSVGYKTYYATPAAGTVPRASSRRGDIIENEFFSVRVDRRVGGGIVSIFDKQNRKELVNPADGPANELVALEEKPDRHSPPWEVFTTGPKHFSRDYVCDVAVDEGPVFSRIVVTGERKDCRRRQEITLYKGVRRIDFTTYLEEYRGEHHLYLVTFPADIEGACPVFEDRYCATVKRRSRSKFDFRTDCEFNFSGCAARRAYQWVDFSHSGLLRFGDKGSYALGMTNIITGHAPGTVDAAMRIQSSFIKKGIPVTHFYDDCDEKRRARLPKEESCLPTRETFNHDLRFATSFRISMDIAGRNEYTKRLLAGRPKSVLDAHRKRLRHDGFSFLFVHDADMPEDWEPLPVLVVSARNAGFLRKAVSRLLRGFSASGEIRLPEECDGADSGGMVEDYGVALLNRGNVLNSVERDDTICLFLMHTSPWGGTPWGKDRFPFFIVPEHKTHVFHYALYPHRGNWRDAQTYRAGYEYNSPLVAVVDRCHDGRLPARKSFLKTSADNLVLTAMKAGDNPTASLSGREADLEKGVILRLYDATGDGASAEITFSRPLLRASRTNLLEEDGDRIRINRNRRSVSVEVGPNAIETLRLVPRGKSRSVAGALLGREKEPVEVYHAKQWEHNLGAEPLGYAPVGISLRGDILTGAHIRQSGVTINKLQLAVTNNYIDRSVEGTVELIPSGGWRTVPEEVPYEIEPGGEIISEVLLSFEHIIRYSQGIPTQKDGIVKARLVHDGQIYQDVLEIGSPSMLEWQVARRGAKIVVTLTNNNDDTIEGMVSIASPLETWGEPVQGYELFDLSPTIQDFVLPGQSSRHLTFNLKALSPKTAGTVPKGPGKSFWAIAKLMYNGNVDYLPVPDLSTP